MQSPKEQQGELGQPSSAKAFLSSVSKESGYNEGQLGSIPGCERYAGKGNGNSFHDYCLENPITEEPGGLQSMGLQAAAAAKLRRSSATLCDPIDGSQLGSSTPGILQARILEWIAISFSNECMHSKSL